MKNNKLFENETQTEDLGGGKTKKTTYNKNGTIESEFYYLNDKRHREDGPASIWYYKNGTIESEDYFLNNKLHREDGPADIWYYGDGTIEREFYYLNNKRHREDGPAYISYYEDGTIRGEYYSLNDKELTEEEWLQKTPLKSKTITSMDELEKIARKEKQEINHIEGEGISYVITNKTKYIYIGEVSENNILSFKQFKYLKN